MTHFFSISYTLPSGAIRLIGGLSTEEEKQYEINKAKKDGAQHLLVAYTNGKYERIIF